MSRRGAQRLAYTLAALAVVLSVPGSVATTWLDWTSPADVPFGLAFALLGVVGALTGALVASRVPGNSVGWLLLVLGLGVGVLLAAGAYAEAGITTSRGPLPAQEVAAWVGDAAGIPLFFGVTGLLLLLFPDGRLPSSRWRWFAWGFTITVAVATISYALLPRKVGALVENPFALSGNAAEVAALVASATDWLALPAMGGCAAALAIRLRRSRGVERAQLKWFTYSASIAGSGLGLTILTPVPFADIAFFLGLMGVVLLPVTAGIAILRYRLYDIDLVIKRTLVYAALTAALVATYLLLVLLFQASLGRVAGDSDLAVAASTLTVAALFRPLRSAIQKAVDRRFFRSRYDAARTLESFSSRLRHELDLEQLAADLRDVVQVSMQPAHLSLWMRGTQPDEASAVTIPGRPGTRKVTP